MSVSRSSLARQKLKQELVKYVEADKQLQNLTKRCNECRKMKREAQDNLSEIGKVLNLEGRTLNYQSDTVAFSYEQPKVGLSQGLLKTSLSEYFCSSNHWRREGVDTVIDEVLRHIEILKEKRAMDKEKNLKISISNRK